MSDNISRLVIMCDDKVVMPIKRMLLGVKGVFEVSDQPVINAKAGPNGVHAKTNGNLIPLFEDFLRKNKLKHVRAPDIRTFQTSIGRSEGGYSGVISKAIDAGLLSKVKGAKNSKYAGYDVHLPRK